jgi:hypothetical protein
MTDLATPDAYGVLTEAATLKIQPLLPGDGWAYRVDFSKRESGIFFESGLDRIC